MAATAGGKHKMGFVGATSYMIGNIIGSGIFITPTSILMRTHSVGLSLIVWSLCAVIAILGSLCYIELGTSIRDPGCDFAYICYVKWYPIAFAFMWVSVLLTYPAVLAIQAEAFGEYLVEGLQPIICFDGPNVIYAKKLLGFALLWLLTWLNFFSLKTFASRFQIIATVAKLLSTGLVIVTGFYLLIFRGWTTNLENPMSGSIWKAGDLVLALYGGLWAYSGWDVLNYGSDEIEHPKRTMPLAMLAGIGIVAVVYVAINVAYFVVLDVDAMSDSHAVAATFSQKVLGNFSFAIPFLIGVLLCGSLNSSIFVGSRYMFAAARQGHLPSCFSCVNQETDSPRAAIFAQTLLAIAVSFIGDLDNLIGYVIFAIWFQRVFTMLGLLWIRYKKIPVHPDAIRMPTALIVFFMLLSASLVLIPVVQEPEVTAIGLVIVASGMIMYFIFVWPKNTPVFLQRINEATTNVTSIVFSALPDLKKFDSLDQNDISPAVNCSPNAKSDDFTEITKRISRFDTDSNGTEQPRQRF
uniref:Uncharacterized protein n=1 Tax=Plectus sambesii TaxID=2011161 RepID=A0A914VEG1_9BILA